MNESLPFHVGAQNQNVSQQILWYYPNDGTPVMWYSVCPGRCVMRACSRHWARFYPTGAAQITEPRSHWTRREGRGWRRCGFTQKKRGAPWQKRQDDRFCVLMALHPLSDCMETLVRETAPLWLDCAQAWGTASDRLWSLTRCDPSQFLPGS